MTLYDFIGMDEREQAEAVWEGTLLANRTDEEHHILLYAIDSFYVEVYWQNLKDQYDCNFSKILPVRVDTGTYKVVPDNGFGKVREREFVKNRQAADLQIVF